MFSKRRKKFNKKQLELRQKREKYNIWFAFNAPINYVDLTYGYYKHFCSKKQSLKKWEIELDIHHQELGLKWDEPVPEDLWEKVAAYCDNDVLATEAVFKARKEDWVARQW